MRTLICSLAFTATLAFGQKPAFEVVSVKPAEPPAPGQGIRMGSRGGPGSVDPGRWSGENLSLADLVSRAYDLRRYDYSGFAWMDTTRFHVQAKVPPGATKDDLRLMLQSMLEERFKLQIHREAKEIAGFELVVAKNGPKLKEAQPPEQIPTQGTAQSSGPLRLGPDGYPVLSGGSGMAMMNGRARWQNSECTMEYIVSMLSSHTGHPVSDATGLKGKYNLMLYWASDSRNATEPDADPGPTIYSAVQEQLGLKLEPKKTAVQILVVDKCEKAPTEN